jgi:hypothetical protein
VREKRTNVGYPAEEPSPTTTEIKRFNSERAPFSIDNFSGQDDTRPVTAAIGSIGEGGGNPTDPFGADVDPIAALTSAELSFASAPNPIAADTSAESYTNNNSSNAALTVAPSDHKPLRSDAATGAAIAATAIRLVREERNLPPYAICIDQRSLAEYMERAWTQMTDSANAGALLPPGADPAQLAKYRNLTRDDWNTRKKIARCIGYAVGSGMLVQASRGRQKPSSDEEGIVAWYALPVGDPAPRPFWLADSAIDRLRAIALRSIARNERTADDFKRYTARVAQYDAEQCRRKNARDRREAEWELTIAAGR